MNIVTNNSFLTRAYSTAALNRVDQEFRQWLQQLGYWSDAAERLFLYLIHNQHVPVPITRQQVQLLEKVIDDALNGINIIERYPALFRDLLQNAALRHEFINIASQAVHP
ncbi:MAG: hypothetical protein H6667_24830 [Ardenticatenaceae bacterium]|nr:hypothetical protein [Ardenticatenaceae bacterium]MCB9446335.1 hypothetical protein [Ardenticatenaceae bacterium]